jgi:hypothetical protein
VNFEPLVQSDNNKSEVKVQWQPTLNNPSNNNSNNLSVNINFNEANNMVRRNKTNKRFVTKFGPTMAYIYRGKSNSSIHYSQCFFNNRSNGLQEISSTSSPKTILIATHFPTSSLQ